MISGNFDMQLVKGATEAQINDLLATMNKNEMGEIQSHFDEQKGCTVIEAFYEDKYTDAIEEVFKETIVEKASAYLYDDGEKNDEPGDFKISKENGKVKEESPVFLSDISVEQLIAALNQKGIQVSSDEKTSKNQDTDLTR